MAKRTSRRRNKQASENLVTQEAVKMGLMGGRYKPLSDHDIEQIHQTTLDVLENIGMGDPIPEFKEAALKSGCTINDKGRILFPRALVEDVIAVSYTHLTLPTTPYV